MHSYSKNVDYSSSYHQPTSSKAQDKSFLFPQTKDVYDEISSLKKEPLEYTRVLWNCILFLFIFFSFIKIRKRE